eukprot:11739772-Ditylum_brightwellii.AAC.1
MIRANRSIAPHIQSAVTLLTTIESKAVILTTVSLNGSPRTAKLAALRYMKQSFSSSYHDDDDSNKSMTKHERHLYERELRRLKERLEQVRTVDG